MRAPGVGGVDPRNRGGVPLRKRGGVRDESEVPRSGEPAWELPSLLRLHPPAVPVSKSWRPEAAGEEERVKEGGDMPKDSAVPGEPPETPERRCMKPAGPLPTAPRPPQEPESEPDAEEAAEEEEEAEEEERAGGLEGEGVYSWLRILRRLSEWDVATSSDQEPTVVGVGKARKEGWGSI